MYGDSTQDWRIIYVQENIAILFNYIIYLMMIQQIVITEQSRYNET